MVQDDLDPGRGATSNPCSSTVSGDLSCPSCRRALPTDRGWGAAAPRYIRRVRRKTWLFA